MGKSQGPGAKPAPPTGPKPVVEFSDAEVDEIIRPLIEPCPEPPGNPATEP
jgi:hypothetical protein